MANTIRSTLDVPVDVHLNGAVASRSHRRAFSMEAIPYLLGASDFIVVILSSFAIYWMYVGAELASPKGYLLVSVIHAFMLMTAFLLTGIYRLESLYAPVEQMKKILLICAMLFMLLLSFAFAFKVSDQFSRIWAFSWWILATSLFCCLRIAAYYCVRRWSESGYLSRNIAIIGAGPQGIEIADKIAQLNQPWNSIVGYFDSRGSHRVSLDSTDYPFLGSLEDLHKFVRENRVDDVILAIPWHADERIVDLIETLRPLPVNVNLGPDLISLRLSGGETGRQLSSIGQFAVLDLASKPFAGWRSAFKFVEDRVIGSILTLLLVPIMLLIAVLIKLDSPGPILFRQNRHGFNNNLIGVYKFRTMYHDRRDERAATLTVENDSRITRVGNFLRRMSLDELPQLLNVIKGDMSLIGPRPHPVEAKAAGEYYADAVAEYAVRHKVKPGISGWAQVNGWRGPTDTIEKLDQRVRHDIYYIENWSVMLEIKILFRTISSVISGTNAF